MASINRESNGRRTIQFVGADGKRRSIRLGNVSQRMAEGFRVKIEALARAVALGQLPDDEVSRWVTERDQVMLDKLAAVGLIPRRETATLGKFLADFIASRTDLKPGTKTNLEQAKQWLIDFFGEKKALRDVTPGEADQWQLWMASKGLGENTARRHTARQAILQSRDPAATDF